MGADSGVRFTSEVEIANFPFDLVENGFYALPKYCFFVDKQLGKWYAEGNIYVEVVNLSRAKCPNRDALDDALHVYLDAMFQFVSERLDEQSIRDILRLQSSDDLRKEMEVKDIAKLIRERWSWSFKEKFKIIDRNDTRYYDARSVTSLIIEGRNQASHQRLRKLDRDFTRSQLFLIAEILGKIKRPDAQREVEDIRDELFDDNTEQLEAVSEAVEVEKAKYEKSIAEVEKRLAAAEENNKKLSRQVADKTTKLEKKKEELEKLSEQFVGVKLGKTKSEKQLKSTSKQLEKLQTVHSACEESLTTLSNQLTTAETEKDNYKERFETTSKEREEVETAWQACEDSLAATRNLFTVSTIGNMVFPPFKTDSAVRILDRRGIDKKNYLLELLEQKQPTIIYVQSEEMVDLLLERVVPEKADVMGKCNERTSEAEDREILEKLENGELIAVVSDTTLSTLASSHCVEHFVFCHLVPGLDEFFRQCEPAFTSEKNAYLHLIYNRKKDIEGLNQWLTQKYPDREVLVKMYRELERLAGVNGDFIKTENIYSELDIEKPSIETGLAIFAELQLLERNGEIIKFLPNVNTDLNKSAIHCRGEKLKKETADFQAFQLERSIDQIWEEMLARLSVDSGQILRESNTHNYDTKDNTNVLRTYQDDPEDSETQSEQSTTAVESDSTASDADTEANQSPKPARANAKVTVEQVREIRSRSAAGESNNELAEEDSEKKPEVKQSEFWAPIRNGEFGGLFAGKPVPISNEGWIAKTIRNIGVCLYLTNQRCYVQIYFHGANGSERREKIMTLFPKSEYAYTYRDSPRETKVQFPVLDKGRKNQDDWDEIRKKLVAMGTDIYNKIDESNL